MADSTSGGSADTQASDASPDRWQSRRLTAVAIVSVAVLTPLVASALVAHVVGVHLPRPAGAIGILGWWTAVIVASGATLLVVDRGARRLLPLAALYRLSLAFPDKAPSRFRVAMLRGTTRQLARRLADGDGLGDTTSEAAQNLVALMTLLGRHDPRSRGHSERVRAFADVIGVEMGLSAPDRDRLHWAALVHDVGKIHVRPALLNKPGRPTPAEWEELRRHPASAEAMLAPLRPWLGEWLDAATQHHERIDGRGYPLGLSGDDITLAGRIVAVADAYDVMTSARSYKKPLPAAQARYELTRNSGTQFDAEVVRAFLRVSVGRAHLAAGPLCWLMQFPAFLRAVSVATGAAAPTAGVVGGAAVAAVSAVGGFTLPIGEGSIASAAPAPPSAEVAVDAVATAPRTEGEHVPSTTTPRQRGLEPPGGQDPTDPADPSEPPGPAPPTTGPVGGPPPTSVTTTPPPPSTTTTAPPSTTTTTAPAPPTTAGPNAPPIAVDDARTVTILSTTTIDVLANDHDDDGTIDAASLEIVSSPSTGTATVVNGRIRYTAPLLGSSAQVGYRICDDDGSCATAVLTISITLL